MSPGLVPDYAGRRREVDFPRQPNNINIAYRRVADTQIARFRLCEKDDFFPPKKNSLVKLTSSRHPRKSTLF